jgi:hypothetical protein
MATCSKSRSRNETAEGNSSSKNPTQSIYLRGAEMAETANVKKEDLVVHASSMHRWIWFGRRGQSRSK